MIRQSIIKLLFPAILTVMASTSAQAMDFSKADDAVELRKGQMDLIGAYFGDMGAMVKNKKPFNAEQYKIDAERLAMLTSWAGTGFESSRYMNSDSKAKPEIWKNQAEFNKMMTAFADSATQLKLAAAGGDLKASIPAFKDVAESCGSCHKKFKNK